MVCMKLICCFFYKRFPFIIVFDKVDWFYTGSSADYPMDLHHKEQLHENSILMMQSQQLSVSF